MNHIFNEGHREINKQRGNKPKFNVAIETKSQQYLFTPTARIITNRPQWKPFRYFLENSTYITQSTLRKQTTSQSTLSRLKGRGSGDDDTDDDHVAAHESQLLS